MSDVRALLRAERAAREPPKPRKATTSQPALPKKRKTPDDETDDDARKRTKEDHETSLASDVVALPDMAQVEEQEASIEAQSTTHAQQQAIDEDEWAAFERDMATPLPEEAAPPPKSAVQALNSATAISAAPTTTSNADSELDRRKEAQRAQRQLREEEVAADKEDAVRHLEDEFEEMDALEARVKRLREQRELLRTGESKEKGAVPLVGTAEEQEAKVEEGEESGDEIDEDDAWVFGKR